MEYLYHQCSSLAKSSTVAGLFRGCASRRTRSFYCQATGKNKTHERIPSREGSFCPALDRYAVQLHRHPQFRFSLPERPVRDDRARGRSSRTGRSGSEDRKSTRLNSSHANISYAVFCLKKKHTTHPASC